MTVEIKYRWTIATVLLLFATGSCVFSTRSRSATVEVEIREMYNFKQGPGWPESQRQGLGMECLEALNIEEGIAR